MKVYAPPIEAGDPPSLGIFMKDGRDAYYAAEKQWLDGLAELARKNSSCDLAGEIVRFPIADGYAQYMIWDGRSMIHLPLGDAWQIPEAHARGLRLADLRENVRRERAIADLFAAKKKEADA